MYRGILVLLCVYCLFTSLFSQDFKINDDTGSAIQKEPAIAMHPNGPVVICWMDGRDGKDHVYHQLFGRKAAPIGGNVRVNTESDSFVYSPKVVMDKHSNYTIVWPDNRRGNLDIYMKKYHANGVPYDSAILVNDDEYGASQSSVAISASPDGEGVIAWTDRRSRSRYDIYAQRLDKTGIPNGPNFKVNQDSLDTHSSSATAMLVDNGFAIIWRARTIPDLGVYRVFGRFYDADGDPMGDQVEISDHPEAIENSIYCDIAAGANDQYMVIWTSTYNHTGDYNLFGSLYDSNGNRTQGPIQLTEPDDITYLRNPVLSAHSEWNLFNLLFLGYEDDWRLYSAMYLPEYGFNIEDRGIHSFTGSGIFFDMTQDHYNSRIFVWADGDEGEQDIYAQLDPIALPMNLTAGSGYNGMVPLMWEPEYGNPSVQRYRIYRRRAGEEIQEIAVVNPAGRPLPNQMLDYIDTEVENNVDYQYAVLIDHPDAETVQPFISATPKTSGYQIKSNWSKELPVIDGQMTPGEWEDAAVIDISSPDADQPVDLYVKNNSTFLYLAVDDFNDNVIDPLNTLNVLFDEDKNGDWEPILLLKEGLFTMASTGSIFTPFVGPYPDGPGFAAPAAAEGVSFAVGTKAGHVQYEAMINMSTSELYAIMSNVVRVAVWINDPGTFYANGYGNSGEWPPNCLWDAAQTLGDIQLAVPSDTVKHYYWPMVNGNRERNNWVRDEKKLYPPFNRLQLLPLLNAEEMIAHDRYLITGSSGDPIQFRVYDMSSSMESWSFELPGSMGSLDCTPATDGDVIIFGGQNAEGLYGYDLLSGTRLWKNTLGSLHVQNPVLDGDRVYVVNDSIYCIDTGTGLTLWSLENEHTYKHITPVVDHEYMYILTGFNIERYNKYTGELTGVLENRSINGPLTLDDYSIYSISKDTLMARDKDAGTRKWSVALEGVEAVSGYDRRLAITDSAICLTLSGVSDSTSEVRVYDIGTGEDLWQYTFHTDEIYGPTLANGVLYITSEGLWAFNLSTGDSLYHDPEEIYNTMQPIISDKKLFFAVSKGVIAYSNFDIPDEITGVVKPSGFHLYPNHPNPFNPVTAIQFDLPAAGNTVLKVHDITGRLVRTLVDHQLTAGHHKVTFDANGLASGVYFYRLQTVENQAVGKMLFIK